MSFEHDRKDKVQSQHVEDTGSVDLSKPHDKALDVLGHGRVEMTDEQSRYICRRIDKVVLPLLMWVYFLQILDKSVIGYGSIFGLQKQANLHGNEYSIIGSSGYWAQLGWQPFSAWLIVKVPTRYLMSFIVTAWGLSMVGLAFSTNFKSLLAFRFLLGLFEASCLPLFTMVTVSWYRRSEQPLRVALWYGTNGVSTMLGSFLAWALSFATGAKLHVYQILFLVVGLATVITGPIIFWRLDNSPAEARFLTPEERTWAVERLRDNNTGVSNRAFKLPQVAEALYSPVTWLFFAMTFAINTGASVTNVFGPLIVSGFGFDSRKTILLNIPFGFVQTAVILSSSYAATRFKRKSVILAMLCIPCIAGSAILYSLNRDKKYQGPNLLSYYLLAFLFGGNPLIVSWIAGNNAGQTKKALVYSLYNAGSSVGNIVGPLLFTVDQKPLYHKGLRAVLGIFISCIGMVVLQVLVLTFLNKRKEKARVALGKPAKVVDRSMDTAYVAGHVEIDPETGRHVETGADAFDDLTDFKNPDFVYVM